mmetsp:Transcript_26764/g.85993  ORF Transcript_26764/g.85993 Transcript_26764/m.85993 type:complete len:709 (+) Transcript_26764:108-2234(+)
MRSPPDWLSRFLVRLPRAVRPASQLSLDVSERQLPAPGVRPRTVRADVAMPDYSVDERMIARSLQLMAREQLLPPRPSSWRFWERWWYDWAYDAPSESLVLQWLWWLFSFPWKILEAGIDGVARGAIFLVGLLPPSLLFSALQLCERAAALATTAACMLARGGLRGLRLLTGAGSSARRGPTYHEKAANAAAGAIAQLVLTQVAPALELVVHLVGNLRGLSRWPHHFAGTLGLQPKKVSALLEAAEALRAAAELLLVCARRTDSGLVALLGWLIHAVRRLRDEAPPSADDVPLPDAITVGEYLGRCSGDELLDEVGDLFSTEEGLAAAAEALPTDPLDEHCTLGPIRRLPALEEELAAALSDCFNPVAQHVSAGFQLHSCTPLHADGSAESSTDADGLHIDLRHPEPSPPPPEPAEPAMPGPPPAACLTKPAQLLISAALGALAEEGGVQLVLLRARWSLQDKGPPSWEACAARTPHAHLCRAHFYRDGKIALLHASDAAAGSRLTVVQHEELPFMPIASLPGGSGAPPPLLGLVLTCARGGSLPVVELDCERSRHFAGAVADRLALAERRDGRWGMCSLVLTQKRRIYFLDLEADEEDEEDDESEEEEAPPPPSKKRQPVTPAASAKKQKTEAKPTPKQAAAAKAQPAGAGTPGAAGWTAAQEAALKKAAAATDASTPNRWAKVAEKVGGGKSKDACKKHFKELGAK